MRNKVALAVSTALMSVSLSSMASFDDIHQSIAAAAPNKMKASADATTAKKFYFEADLAAGQYTYIVRLKDMPLATYDGSIAGLAATNPKIAKKELFAKLANSKMSSQQVRNELRLDTKSKEAVQYTNYLESQQQTFLSQAQKQLGKNAEVIYSYKNAVNGMALKLTQAEALKLSRLASVEFVERERIEHMDTDTGPIHIGATQVWEGEGPTATNMGEGVIIGVIDSGVNSDHASFADVGGDGYDHTNPWGEGVYVGDCAGEFASMCNDKLIGVRSYESVTSKYDDAAVFGDTPPAKNGEDYGGHGSHTASTAGGNIIKNAPLVAPATGEAQSDGIVNSGFEFDQISGVAPHANIVAYQICWPGDQGDTYSGCPGAAIIAALDDAVEDGVDVLNYSISGGGNPWTSSTELGFLAAQEAGIFAAVSAGNGGPGAYTTSKNAPWYTVVGASTHGRTLDTFVKFNDKNYVFTSGTGPIIEDVVTGSPRAALNVDADNVEGCDAYAADAFKDSIALISRGGCAFSDKVTNATAAGADAVIVYNNKDGDATLTMASLEDTTIPAVMISQNSGTALLADLADNASMDISIDPTITLNVGQADDMAKFSSRGPNSTAADIMTPSVTAPGVSIYAAYSDEQYGHDVTGTAPTDYNFLSGTSMSAPHTSGAGAVLKSAHPTWTPDNIRSALMLTASQDVRKEDGETAADVFDMGAGSIRVNLATNTGLIMDETFANYMRANPAVAGVPSSLNIPSMTNTKCIDTCEWTRTFTATKDASWTVTPTSASDDMTLTVSPVSFDIKAGETQTITVTADVSESDADVWNFGDITLSAEDTPDARLPVLVQVADNNLPVDLAISANRADGSINYTGLKANGLTNPVAAVYEAKAAIDPTVLGVPDGSIAILPHTFTEDSAQALFTMTSDEAPDADLEVWSAVGPTYLRGSFSSSSNEAVSFTDLPAGDYIVVARAYTASAEGATDNVTINISTTSVHEDFVSKSVEASISSSATPTAADDSFDLALTWTGVEESTGGIVEIKSADAGVTETKVIPWTIALGDSDVEDNVSEDLANGVQTMMPGDAQSVAFDIAPNFTNEDKTYTLVAEISAGHEVANVNNGGVVDGDTITWTVTRAVGQSTDVLPVGFDLIPRQAGTNYEVKLSNTLGTNTIESMYTFGVVEVAPVAAISTTASVQEESAVSLDGTPSSDLNNDTLAYEWVQLSGTPVTFTAANEVINFTAPKVSTNETMSFQLTVNDGNGNTDTTVASISIVNKKSSGSFGWLTLLLTPMLWLRRKKS